MKLNAAKILVETLLSAIESAEDVGSDEISLPNIAQLMDSAARAELQNAIEEAKAHSQL